MTVRPAKDAFWTPHNLTEHWKTHPVGKHGGCTFWDSLNPGGTSEKEYEVYSISVPGNCWLVFAAKQLKPQAQPRRRHHVDDDLVKTITEMESDPPKLSDSMIATCFHDHTHSGGSCEAPEPDVNERRLRHLRRLSQRLSSDHFADFEFGNPSRTPPKIIQDELKVMAAKHV